LDASTAETACERADREFEEFVEEHRSCTSDDDCTVVFDCGPHIDARPINPDAVDDAYELMEARCEGYGYDGEVYGAKCDGQYCVQSDEIHACCGCPLDEPDSSVPDSGTSLPDGGPDSGL
jgi:hypothetical protein